jgi:hypothetical protein
LFQKTLIALAATVALGCVPVATNALAAGHPGGNGGGHAMGGRAMGGHAMGGYARGGQAGGYGGYARGGRGARYDGGYDGGPIYDSCGGPGYACPGYGVPLVGELIDGALGGYGPY